MFYRYIPLKTGKFNNFTRLKVVRGECFQKFLSIVANIIIDHPKEAMIQEKLNLSEISVVK